MPDDMAVRGVIEAYRTASGLVLPFTLVHLTVRLIVTALLLPLAALGLQLALLWSGEQAVTDADIAGFLLSPSGAIGALLVAGVLIVAAVLDVALMTAILRRPASRIWPRLMTAWRSILPRIPGVFALGLLLVVRVAIIVAPFAAAGLGAAALLLTDHDINYYLTYRPPAFLAAVAIIGTLLLVMAGFLVWRLSGWALALHLRLIDSLPSRVCFARSEDYLRGRQGKVVVQVVIWLAVRLALAASCAALMGALTVAAQDLVLPDLRRVVLASVLTLGLWSLGNAVVSALSNGALAVLLNALHGEVAPERHEAVSEAAPRGTVFIAAGLAAAAGIAAIGAVSMAADMAGRFKAPADVEVIAHRGAAGARPENTLAAIEKALEDRADWVEIDVQEIADGTVIVTHDSDFMKQAGVPLKVWDASMADLDEIDVGAWFDPAYAGTRVPTLRAVLEAAKGRGRVLIELKYYGHDDRLEERVLAAVEETGMADDVMIMSLKPAGVGRMQALRPEWPVGILAARALGNVAAFDAAFVAVNTGQVSPRLIRNAKASGKKIYVWTVDDPRGMARMISMGVDGLITNEPALAQRVIAAHRNLTTAERLLLALTDRFRLESFDLSAEASDA